jgi:serine/threonine protein kinase
VLKQQINILQSVNHKNICSLKQVFETDRAICLVLEL